MAWTIKQRMARKAARAAKSSWWLGPLVRGVAMAIDVATVDRVMEASRAEAALFANLSAHAGPDMEALLARLGELHGKSKGCEARFVTAAALHALGESELPTLVKEPWAAWAPSLRDCRRRLRRMGSDLAHGRPLGGAGHDRLAEAGAYLDRLREAGVPGVGWPRAQDQARRERSELSASVGPAPESASKRL